MVESDEDDEILALKDRLAAYNLDSSPDQSGMLSSIITSFPISLSCCKILAGWVMFQLLCSHEN